MKTGTTVTHGWDWWAYQFRVIHRQGIPGIAAWDDRLVAFIVAVLDLREGARVLDLACGSGEHSRRLAQRGMAVTGLDIAPSLVSYCAERSAALGLEATTFVEGDMRELMHVEAFDRAFDAVVALSTSFGFFDDATNQRVLDGIAGALRAEGRVLLQLMDPLTFAGRQRKDVYQEERPEGTYWTETWFDPSTFTSHSVFRFTDRSGATHLWTDQEKVRVYTLPELRRMFDRAGLTFSASYGDVALPPRPYGPECSRQLVVVGERGADLR